MKFLYTYICNPLLFVLIIFNSAFADHYKRQAGIDVQHYEFKLGLNDSTDKITGSTEIEIKFLSDSLKMITLDLAGPDSAGKGMIVSRVVLNGNISKYIQSDNHLEIYFAFGTIKNEIKIITINYSGIPADGLIISRNKYGDRTFFGDNWPDRAHYWLPTIDHPSDKATCDFIVTAPAGYKVIANGILVEESSLGNDFRLTHWKENVPIPTKIMVIGAAKFAIQYKQESNCVPVESWVYPQDREKGFYDFSPAKEIIKYFLGLIGEFPYEKLANVESKTIYGGMENASAIFYAESEITGTRKSLVTIAHEIAHQWFGDAVTEADWNHIWLSEGFATFFQNVFIGHQFGNDSLLNALKLERRQIVHFNQANPKSAIIDTTITKLTDLLNINSYQKGGWVLRMLQHYLGDELFWKGLKLYYKTYKNSNALTKDFESAMEQATGKNLEGFFNEWIYKPGLPYLSGGWNYNSHTRQLIVRIEQVKQDQEVMNLPMDIGIYFGKSKNPEIKKVEISAAKNEFKFTLKRKPVEVVLDPGVWLLMNSDFKEN
jgi:aminopeptidase N